MTCPRLRPSSSAAIDSPTLWVTRTRSAVTGPRAAGAGHLLVDPKGTWSRTSSAERNFLPVRMTSGDVQRRQSAWQYGHQNRLRPTSSAAATGVPQMRHG
jgi:hypothetical protein